MKFLGLELKKAVNKNSQLIGQFRSDGLFFDRMNDGFFIPKELFERSHANALISMYHDIPEVQAPINYIIDKMSIVDFYHVKKIGSREKVIENSEYMDILKQPNQYQKQSDFIKDCFLNYLVLGGLYINRLKIIGMGYKLFVLPTAKTKPIFDKKSKEDPRFNNIIGYKTDWGKGEVKLDVEEVIYQLESNLNPEPDSAQSRLHSAIMASDSLRYNYEARVQIYKERGAMGILSPKDSMVAIQKEDADRMQKSFMRENGITRGKSPICVTSRALEYKQIGLDVGSLKLNENKLQDFQTVCNVMQVDPALFDNTQSTYNNKVLAKKNFWEDVGMPKFNSYLELLGEVFNLPPNEYFKADYSNIPAMQDDFSTKVNANSTAYKDGAITHAEYREAIGFEGGEDKYITEQQASEQETSSGVNEENEQQDE